MCSCQVTEQNIHNILFIKVHEIFQLDLPKRYESFEETSHNVSERELYGYQCIGQYIMHHLYKKTRNSKNYKSTTNQFILSILEPCRNSYS